MEVYNEAKETYEEVQGKIDGAKDVYNDIAPDVEKAYGITLSALVNPDDTSDELQTEFKLNNMKTGSNQLLKIWPITFG